MRLLVDTSVWSLLFRKRGPSKEPAVVRLVDALEREDEVVLTGLILQEVLQAFRTPSTFRRVASRLAPFPLIVLRRVDRDFERIATVSRLELA